MFNQSTCKLCGDCISKCPSMEMPVSQAKEEIIKLVESRHSSEILKNCAGCGYCNVICPTQSNPTDLRKSIRQNKIRDSGTNCMWILREDVPDNIMTIALKHNKEEKEKTLEKFSNPPKSDELFFIGCSFSYIYTDLIKTNLLKDLPIAGGLKFCCGAQVYNSFGIEEAKIRGKQLLEQLNEIEAKKLITFCPECDYMLRSVYPNLVKGYQIKAQNIAEYFLAKHQVGELKFKIKLDKKIAYHDSCAWRKLDTDVYEAPRQLLQAMGADLVEMKHNRKKSMCCGTPLLGSNPVTADKIASKRIAEAVEVGAEAIAVSCNGCLSLSKKAAEHSIDVFNITELAQLCIGEEPLHKNIEAMDHLLGNMIETFTAKPDLMKTKFRIENGELIKC